MVAPLFDYQRARLALVWLCIMVHLTWPKRSAATTPAPALPIQSKRKRSNEPKPCAGLPTKPPWALCEREAAHPQPAPPGSPEPMPPTLRRPPHGGPRAALLSPAGLALSWLAGAGATCGPTAIPVAVGGASFSVLPAQGTFWRPTAPSGMASRWRWS